MNVMYDPLETVPDFKYCKWVVHKEGGGRATAQLQRWNFQGAATCEKNILYYQNLKAWCQTIFCTDKNLKA